MVVAIIKKGTDELICTIDVPSINQTVVIHKDYDIRMDGVLPEESADEGPFKRTEAGEEINPTKSNLNFNTEGPGIDSVINKLKND